MVAGSGGELRGGVPPLRRAIAREQPREQGEAPRVDEGVWTGIVGWQLLPRGLVMNVATGAGGDVTIANVMERARWLEYTGVIHAGKAKWEYIMIERLRWLRWLG